MLQGWLHTSRLMSSALCYGESGGKLAHDNSIKLHLFISTSYFAVRRYAPPADRGGCTSVCGQIHSPHSSGGLQGSCCTAGLGTVAPRPSWTDRQIVASLNAPPLWHTHTHTFNSHFLGLPSWASTRQVKPIWILLKQPRDSKWQWHQLGHMQVCTSLQTDNYTSTPPLYGRGYKNRIQGTNSRLKYSIIKSARHHVAIYCRLPTL